MANMVPHSLFLLRPCWPLNSAPDTLLNLLKKQRPGFTFTSSSGTLCYLPIHVQVLKYSEHVPSEPWDGSLLSFSPSPWLFPCATARIHNTPTNSLLLQTPVPACWLTASRQHIKLKQWLFVNYWVNKLCETQKILVSVTFSFDTSAIKCPAIFAPDQGSLDCSHDHGEFSVGSTCRFSCNRGFELVGSTSVECTVSGSWSSPPPTCTGNDILTREAVLGVVSPHW